MDGHDTVTGHIISTTIGGKNGEPKQVESWLQLNFLDVFYSSLTGPMLTFSVYLINAC